MKKYSDPDKVEGLTSTFCWQNNRQLTNNPQTANFPLSWFTYYNSSPFPDRLVLFSLDVAVVQVCVRLFVTPSTAAHQASLSLTISWRLPKFICVEAVMPSNHLILCRPLLLPPSVFPSIRVFSNKSAVRIRWPKYWSSSFSISPSKED